MSQTVEVQGDARLKGFPEYNSASHLRACAEEAHYEPIRRAFVIPLYIGPASPTDADRCLEFKDFFSKNVARRFDMLRPDDCRLFCWKDCAIYGNAGLNGMDHLILVEDVYKEWFPHRAMDKDVSDGNFFAKFMRFKPEGTSWTLQEILGFHSLLCERLNALEKEIPDMVPVNPATPAGAWPAHPREAEYRLRKTFPAVFIVLENGWRDRGVLLVWRSEDDASRHHCKADGDIMPYAGNDGCDLGQACVFRCSLRRAMQLVVSTDSKRAQRRTEYNELLEETLGDDDAGMRGRIE